PADEHGSLLEQQVGLHRFRERSKAIVHERQEICQYEAVRIYARLDDLGDQRINRQRIELERVAKTLLDEALAEEDDQVRHEGCEHVGKAVFLAHTCIADELALSICHAAWTTGM